MTFPNVIRYIILDYAATWELLDWIDTDYISWGRLVINPNAVDFMIKHKNYTRWGEFSGNPNHAAFYYIRANMPCLLDPDDLAGSSCPEAVAYVCDHIHEMQDPRRLSRNPLAIPWLRDHPKWIDTSVILSNPGAKDLLASLGLLDKIPRWADEEIPAVCDISAFAKRGNRKDDMMYLCQNPSAWAMEIVGRNIRHIWNVGDLLDNPFAGDVLKKCVDILDWQGMPIISESQLSLYNKHASDLDIANPLTIDWSALSMDPRAINFLRENMDIFKKEKNFSLNPAIFELRRPPDVFELL